MPRTVRTSPRRRCAADGCSQPITDVSRGRPRHYCSNACRQRAYRQRVATERAATSDDTAIRQRLQLAEAQIERCAQLVQEHAFQQAMIRSATTRDIYRQLYDTLGLDQG